MLQRRVMLVVFNEHLKRLDLSHFCGTGHSHARTFNVIYKYKCHAAHGHFAFITSNARNGSFSNLAQPVGTLEEENQGIFEDVKQIRF